MLRTRLAARLDVLMCGQLHVHGQCSKYVAWSAGWLAESLGLWRTACTRKFCPKCVRASAGWLAGCLGGWLTASPQKFCPKCVARSAGLLAGWMSACTVYCLYTEVLHKVYCAVGWLTGWMSGCKAYCLYTGRSTRNVLRDRMAALAERLDVRLTACTQELC